MIKVQPLFREASLPAHKKKGHWEVWLLQKDGCYWPGGNLTPSGVGEWGYADSRRPQDAIRFNTKEDAEKFLPEAQAQHKHFATLTPEVVFVEDEDV